MTLEENLLEVRSVASPRSRRWAGALLRFQRFYDQIGIVERHGYRTPGQVRAEQLGAPATSGIDTNAAFQDRRPLQTS